MSAVAPRIIILGGGTAGWMAACLLAKAWPAAAITLVESREIGIVGVGEGSTPQLRAFFAALGIAEAEWMPRCHATYKVGIGFRGWSERPGFDRYFHPFATELDGHTEGQFFHNARVRRQGGEVWAHPDRFYLPARLAAERKAPLAPETFPFDVSYGYHFDAYLVGAFLREHAIGRGVRHLERRVDEVCVADGLVSHLVAEGGMRIEAELFVDASGFRGLICAALGVPFLSFGANLFNDRAVVMPTPADPHGTNSSTQATALSAGWCWDIPLTSRTGNGYVYSSRYVDDDAAEAELRRHLGLLDTDVASRRLRMRVGRVAESWTGNCLAIGLAQGFIEPLEATALHIVQATVEGFIEAWEGGQGTPVLRDRFNAAIARRYEGVRDYIVCHYRVSRRTDTDYWRDNAANDRLSDELKAVMTAWFTGADLVETIERLGIGGYYAPLSWHCLLAGYGVFPERVRPVEGARVDMARIDSFIARCGLNFADHKAVLEGMTNG